MLERTTVEIGRIVVIASDEKNPVVRFVHTLGVLFDDILIIASVFKTESTVSGHTVPCHIYGAAVQYAGLRVGPQGNAEERRHAQPAVGGVLRKVPPKR